MVVLRTNLGVERALIVHDQPGQYLIHGKQMDLQAIAAEEWGYLPESAYDRPLIQPHEAKYLTIDEVVQITGRTRITILRWVKRGLLAQHDDPRDKTRKLYAASEVEDLLDGKLPGGEP
jgi:hypothetical protein